jgi:hypothetical protein
VPKVPGSAVTATPLLAVAAVGLAARFAGLRRRDIA